MPRWTAWRFLYLHEELAAAAKNPNRVTMYSRVILFLVGALYICPQVLATDVYIAELVVESNVTLEATTIISVFNSTTSLQIDQGGTIYTLTLSHSEMVAECVLVGDETSCECSKGYIWSNEVCYGYSCCREMTCRQNVSHIVPLCVAKVSVHINGTIVKNTGLWGLSNTSQLVSKFEELNGFEYLNVTGQRLDNTMTDFEVAVSVRFNTSKLQGIVTHLESSLGAILWVDTTGMVTIESPDTVVCYESNPELKCTFEEPTDRAGWNMSKKYERFELNSGSVVKLEYGCTPPEYGSCVKVTLQKVTGVWSGLYECGFISGSVRHTAKTELIVALLPDVITMKIEPLTADCSTGPVTSPVTIKVTATIPNTTENFEVWWSNMGERKANLDNTSDGDNLIYTFDADVNCEKTDKAIYFNITFKNNKNQTKSARVDIPVIYAGATFCSEDGIDGELWPKTPSGDTVINTICPEGKVGYRSRTCVGVTWQPVFHYCVNEELKKVLNAAENFRKGLGATQEVAMDIFAGLKNRSTSSSSDSGDSVADISASIDVLSVMASATETTELDEDVLPDFVDAASNMLNKSWNGVNTSVVHHMSSNYLHSVEGLVKNIKVNNSDGLNTQNLELKFCSSRDCNVSVFGIDVNLNKTNGIMKTVAVKNLMDKLRNNFDNTLTSSLLISVTLDNNNDSSVDIIMEFPPEQLKYTKPLCVFWNTTGRDWSKVGCKAHTNYSNGTVCECNHLTSFSVLMSKGDVPNAILDIITTVGLGISICSLLIFLIIESLVWSAVVKSNLSHFRHTAIVNIAVFLLLGDCCFLASSESLSETWCLVLTVCKHLFFLAMFSWMLCMSVMLVHQLIFVFSPLRKRVFMFLSSIIGYVCPILIVGCSYVYAKYTDKPYYRKTSCWLVYERLLVGSLHAFILPIGTIILTNVFSMVVVIVTLLKSSAPEGSKTDDKETAKSILKVVVFLTPVFGVTWIIGFAMLILEENTLLHQVATYSFTILNSFQGLFLLITGCFAEQKVREEMLKLITAKTKGKSESKTNLTSATYAKEK